MNNHENKNCSKLALEIAHVVLEKLDEEVKGVTFTRTNRDNVAPILRKFFLNAAGKERSLEPQVVLKATRNALDSLKEKSLSNVGEETIYVYFVARLCGFSDEEIETIMSVISKYVENEDIKRDIESIKKVEDLLHLNFWDINIPLGIINIFINVAISQQNKENLEQQVIDIMEREKESMDWLFT